ncbi:hypothetical protein F5146DRAFT_930344, partial [Armillaria mellea]
LWERGGRCWLGDLAIVLRNIGFARVDTTLEVLTSPEDVCHLLHELPVLANKLVADEIMASTRLDLVRGRVKRTRSGRVTADPLVFRSYLLLRIPAHRIALTRLLTSNHALGIERGRWLRMNGSSVTVPRSFRICRCCRDDVEDECHALFVCTDATLQEMRDEFVADIWKRYPALRGRSSSPKDLLHTLLTYSDLLPRLGRYVYDVLKHIEDRPMYIHLGVTG